MYVTNYGVPNDKLPPRGKQFLESFASERGGDPGPDFAASYGAQGVEILLDAIARWSPLTRCVARIDNRKWEGPRTAQTSENCCRARAATAARRLRSVV